jgi:hypothetical protein
MLKRLFSSWALKTQRKEAQAYVDGLSSMDGKEVGLVLAVATHMRNKLEETGIDLMDPIVTVPVDPSPILTLGRMIRQYQREGSLTDSAAAMVWLHTMRVGARHELRPVAREIWGQLARGMPHVMNSAAEVWRMSGQFPLTAGYDRFPAGLSPVPEP